MSKLYCNVTNGKIDKPNKLPPTLSSITDYGETINPSSLSDDVLCKHFGYFLYIQPVFNSNKKQLGDYILLEGRKTIGRKIENLNVNVPQQRLLMTRMLNKKMLERLSDTDWYFIRRLELGDKIPESVTKHRNIVRSNGAILKSKINSLRNPDDTMNFKRIFLEKLKNI